MERKKDSEKERERGERERWIERDGQRERERERELSEGSAHVYKWGTVCVPCRLSTCKVESPLKKAYAVRTLKVSRR